MSPAASAAPPCSIVLAASASCCASGASRAGSLPSKARRASVDDVARQPLDRRCRLPARRVAGRARAHATAGLGRVDQPLEQLCLLLRVGVERRSPWASAMSAAARLPLSTVETYRGWSGASVAVSYQFRKWPWCRSRPSSVVSVQVEPPDERFGRDIAQIVCGQRRQQPHADVGRRRAPGELRGVAVLLIVVGWQPRVRLGHERFEVPPRLARRPAQQRSLASVSGRSRGPTGRLSQ